MRDIDKSDGVMLYSRIFYRKPSYGDCIRQNGSLIVVHRVELSLFFHRSLKRSAIHVPDIDICPLAKKRKMWNVHPVRSTVRERKKKRTERELNGRFLRGVRRAFDVEGRNQSFLKAQ